MADNSTLPATGDIIASDDIGGVKFQRIKLIHGPDNTNIGDVARSNGLPVMLSPASSASASAAISVASAATAVTLLAANLGVRNGVIIYNDSTADLYILLATGVVTTTNFSVKLTAAGYLTLGAGDYAGVISGIWSAANGAARITEFTA